MTASTLELEVNGYVEIERSQVLPTLDIELLARCINLSNQFKQSINFGKELM
ncbi:hypothetical protein H6S82_01570 [Planktothrix sp. FACHB-1355]|uniref:Uncharacterized protein n=1 Tax=Aerosakkonema funiforme FACHB-1375 TaxID=2949571 RepID=A0A926VD54_9CYAN|nr:MULTISPECIES: hypothetical protein [Oscillatoriales]MBD2181335.1 hypothetical protein [Aerosakkonema funiforme FACHB-1375]MBD3557557.1 hypothetical protein [Planktothrix sp. FACHB-1355]